MEWLGRLSICLNLLLPYCLVCRCDWHLFEPPACVADSLSVGMAAALVRLSVCLILLPTWRIVCLLDAEWLNVCLSSLPGRPGRRAPHDRTRARGLEGNYERGRVQLLFSDNE